MSGKKYTKEEKQFLKSFIPGHTYKETENEFEKKFSKRITRNQLKAFSRYYHIRTGINSGRIKKGSIPKNYRPIGSEKILKSGYVLIKTADPGKWEMKHKFVWEQKHGKIPKGYTLLFADRNQQNVTLDNLRLVSRKTQVVMAHEGLLSCGAEYIDTAIAIAELKRVCREAEKNGKRNKRKREPADQNGSSSESR